MVNIEDVRVMQVVQVARDTRGAHGNCARGGSPAHQGNDLAELIVGHDEVAQRRRGVDQQAVGGLANVVRVQALLSVALNGLLTHARPGQLWAACMRGTSLSSSVSPGTA